MKRETYLFLIFALVLSLTFSQEYRITGKISDEGNTPMALANVLLKSMDSVLIQGTSTNEKGGFVLENIKEGHYLLSASYIENTSDIISINLTADTAIGTLIIQQTAQELNEVVVTSQKPRLERKVDRLVFNIEHTAVADGDIWEVLKRTPSIIIINDKLTVKGSDAIGILINGREVNLPKEDILNLLSGTSASGVQAIEVITSPPAKYNSEDAVLINIVMKKNLIAGYNGAIHNKYVQGILPKHTVGTDHYFKGQKTGLSVNYSFNHQRNVIKFTDITNFFEDNGTTATWTAEQEYLRERKRHNISAFFDYDINKGNKLSLSTITIWQPPVKKHYDTETLILGDTALSGFNTVNSAVERQLNTSYYIDYERKLDEKGAELSMNAHYTFYDYTNEQRLNTSFFDTERNLAGQHNFMTNSGQQINLYSLQTDYVTPLGKSATFESGLRYAGIRSKSSVVQQGFDRNQPGIEPTEAGKFNYDESIYALYTSYSAKWNLWRLKSGLRTEYTETMGRWDAGGQRNENKYLELFPSFSIRFAPNEKHSFNLYYYRKINRPRYASINPFQVFQSNFSTIEGDPNLLPATRHYVAGGYTFKNSYTVELFYRNEKHRLQELIFQNNDTRLLRFIKSNLDRAISYGIDLSLSKDFTDFWNCYFLASFYDQTYAFKNLGTEQRVENNLFSWVFRTSNGFTFLNDRSLTADLTFLYSGPQVSGNAEFDAFGALDLLFRKTLWNKKARISLGVQDIFNQGNQFNSRNYLDQSGTSLRRAENRLFTLGFRYKFGNTKIRDNQKPKRAEESDRL